MAGDWPVIIGARPGLAVSTQARPLVLPGKDESWRKALNFWKMLGFPRGGGWAHHPGSQRFGLR
jgi:hypothetical protein